MLYHLLPFSNQSITWWKWRFNKSIIGMKGLHFQVESRGLHYFQNVTSINILFPTFVTFSSFGVVNKWRHVLRGMGTRILFLFLRTKKRDNGEEGQKLSEIAWRHLWAAPVIKYQSFLIVFFFLLSLVWVMMFPRFQKEKVSKWLNFC